MAQAEGFDVFLSYACSDSKAALGLKARLEAAGLRVWFDTEQIRVGHQLKEQMSDGLGRCRLLLALYSENYSQRHVCLKELTSAWLSSDLENRGMPEGPPAPPRRVFVVVKDPDTTTPQGLLRGQAWKGLADEGLLPALQKYLQGLPATPMVESFSEAVFGQARQGFHGVPARLRHFVGRTRELWDIHSNLQGETAIVAGSANFPDKIHGDAQVTGMAGMGKSVLAAEYVHRFAPAWPGGVIWLRGGGPDSGSLTARQRIGQYRQLLAELRPGVDYSWLDQQPEERQGGLLHRLLGEALAGRRRWLWVVDDLPHGLTPAEVELWKAPAGGHTLLTSRDRPPGAFGRIIEMTVLDEKAAFALLTRLKAPLDGADETAARALCEQLGYYPLALDVAAALRQRCYGSFITLLNELKQTPQALIDQSLQNLLPHQAASSILHTLGLSISLVGEEARGVLRAASLLAAGEPVALSILSAVQPGAADAADTLYQASLATVKEGQVTVYPVTCQVIQWDMEEKDFSTAPLKKALTGAFLADFSQWLGMSDRASLPRRQPLRQHLPHALLLALPAETTQQAVLAGCLGQFMVAEGQLQAGRQLRQQGLDVLRRVLGDEHPDTLRAMNNLANSLAECGEVQAARVIGEDVLSLRRRVLGDEHPDTLSAMNNLASSLAECGEVQAARVMREDALSHFRRVLGDEHPDTLKAMNNLTNSLAACGKVQAARRMREDVLSLRRQVLGDEHPDTLSAMANLASSLDACGDFQAARRMREDVLLLQRRVLGDEHPDTLSAMNDLACSLDACGDFRTARQMGEDVLSLYRRVLGDEHPHTLKAMTNLANSLDDYGDFQAARQMREDVLSLYRCVLGDEHPDTLKAMTNLANSLDACGDFQAARRMGEDVLSLYRRALGDEHPDTLSAMSNLANSLSACGEVQAARVMREEVLSLRRRVLGEEHPDTLKAMNNLARSLDACGDFQAARVMEEDVLSLYRRVLGDEHPHTLKAMNNLANSLAACGEVQAARRMGEDVLSLCRHVLGDKHPDTLKAMNNLATYLAACGEVQAARRMFEDVLSLRRRVLGEEHPDTIGAMGNLARSLDACGEAQAARGMEEDVLSHFRRVLGEEHPDTLKAMSNLARNLFACGEVQAARKMRADVLSRLRRVFPEGHPRARAAAEDLVTAWMDDREGELRDWQEFPEILRLVTLTLGESHPAIIRLRDYAREQGKDTSPANDAVREEFYRSLDLLTVLYHLVLTGRLQAVVLNRLQQRPQAGDAVLALGWGEAGRAAVASLAKEAGERQPEAWWFSWMESCYSRELEDFRAFLSQTARQRGGA